MSLPKSLWFGIAARLTADAPLVAMVAQHPDDATKPAFLPPLGNAGPPVYPCIVIREEIGKRDPRFRAAPGDGDTASAVYDTYYQFTYWTQNPDGTIAYDVQDRLIAIFQGQAFAITGGWTFDCQEMTFEMHNWHDGFNAFFTLFRYRFRTERG